MDISMDIMDSTRRIISIVVISIWIAVPAIVIIGVVFQFTSVEYKEVLMFWHQLYSWIATLILGFLFGGKTTKNNNGIDTA